MSSNNILIWTIVSIFIILGTILPYFNDNSYNTELFDGDNVGLSDILFSISTIAFWSFDVHPLINLIILQPLRIILYVIIYDKLRGI